MLFYECEKDQKTEKIDQANQLVRHKFGNSKKELLGFS